MKVYLDTNILVDIENGIIQEDMTSMNSDVGYYYSAAHIDELLNGLDKHPELKDIRIYTIEHLCGTKYIATEVGSFVGGFEEVSPLEVYEFSMQHKALHDYLNRVSDAIVLNRNGFLEWLGISKIEIGNYKPTEIFNILDDKLKKHWGYGIKVYLEESKATTGRSVFSSLFNLLDYACYWHDKSNTSRLYDSSHAYFAQYCDVLVSNDRRMRIKTEAVYSYLGIETKVYSSSKFLRVLSMGK